MLDFAIELFENKGSSLMFEIPFLAMRSSNLKDEAQDKLATGGCGTSSEKGERHLPLKD